MIRPGLLTPWKRLLIALLPVLALAATACGFNFGAGGGEVEMFQGMRIAGERRAGSELILTVGLTSTYPVPVRVSCFYEDYDALSDDQRRLSFEERAIKIGELVLEPVEDGRPPERDVPIKTLTFRFTVTRPGDYFVACNTPAAADNGVGMSFEID